MKKIDVDNNTKLFIELDKSSNWSIHQFQKDDNNIELGPKEIFPLIPTPLVIDFFISNSIDEFIIRSNNEIFLKATGIDDMQWSYLLISNK